MQLGGKNKNSIKSSKKNSENPITNGSDQKSVNQKPNETFEVQERQEVDDDDDDIEWITPDNIDEYQAKEQNFSDKKDNKNMKVACMTTDYSVQVCKNFYTLKFK